MAKLDDAVTAKIKKDGKNFEVLVDCDKAVEFRKGGSVSITDVLVIAEIFTDAKKGTRASESDFEKLFNTQDKLKVAEKIIKNGHISLSAEFLKKERDLKKKQIINLIVRNSVDNNGRPHPPTRIESALSESKVKIDENKSAEEQVVEIVSQLKKILPISYEIRELEVKIPSLYAPKSYGLLKKYGVILHEYWDAKGLIVSYEIPAGLQEAFEIDLNNFTKGSSEFKIVRSK